MLLTNWIIPVRNGSRFSRVHNKTLCSVRCSESFFHSTSKRLSLIGTRMARKRHDSLRVSNSNLPASLIETCSEPQTCQHFTVLDQSSCTLNGMSQRHHLLFYHFKKLMNSSTVEVPKRHKWSRYSLFHVVELFSLQTLCEFEREWNIAHDFTAWWFLRNLTDSATLQFWHHL